MRKTLGLIFTLVLVCCLTVPTFAYSTAVTYDAAKEPPHVVTFDPNGGRVTTTTLELPTDGYVTNLPTPTRPGYTFEGWYTDSTFTTEFTENTLVNQNVTVIAKWKYRGGGGAYVPPQSSGDNVTSPETFDGGIALYVGMSVLSATGGAALVIGKKRREE